MPLTNPRLIPGPVGPLKDKRVVDISAATEDVEWPGGAIVQVGTAGDIKYRTLHGSADLTETGLSAGDVLRVGDIPVLVRFVRVDTDTTVTSLVAGFI